MDLPHANTLAVMKQSRSLFIFIVPFKNCKLQRDFMEKKYKAPQVTFFTLLNCSSGAVVLFCHLDSHHNDHVFLHLK